MVIRRFLCSLLALLLPLLQGLGTCHCHGGEGHPHGSKPHFHFRQILSWFAETASPDHDEECPNHQHHESLPCDCDEETPRDIPAAPNTPEQDDAIQLPELTMAVRSFSGCGHDRSAGLDLVLPEVAPLVSTRATLDTTTLPPPFHDWSPCPLFLLTRTLLI
jgi:hypothetical protein